ncbi:MAG TPA: DUF2071 domain-containing protein [Thermoanaerobaculia bacterium]|nr:DUF2071 domain-containing protein [Thermoanaerobaculia bacterium]
MTSTFLTAEWRDLVMLNYEVPPRVLASLVPAGTELDVWQGRTLASLVGFRFLRTRVLGVPIPFHRDFEEVNLRFYVRRRGPEGWRRGVVFVKEIVPKWAIAWVARTVYNERYVSLPMRHRVVPPGAGTDGLAEYGWQLGGRWYRLAARMRGAPAIPPPGSEEEFITEHYWGYALQKNGSAFEYRVEHPQWEVWAATEAAFEGDAGALYGPDFSPFFTGPPVSAFVAAGSPVSVRYGVLAPGV